MLPVQQPSSLTSTPRVDAMQLIEWLHAGGYVLYHPRLAHMLGYFKAAVFMGHALYWTRYTALRHPERDGWFFVTAQDCDAATGLSRREQETCRIVLGDAGLLAERRSGSHGRLHYQVQLDALAHFLELGVTSGSMASSQGFEFWLSSATNFYKPLADVSGSVASGLYLSYLLQTQRAILHRDESQSVASHPVGFFKATSRHLSRELGLSDKVLRNARAQLITSGLIVQRGAMVRIELDRLAARLAPISRVQRQQDRGCPSMRQPCEQDPGSAGGISSEPQQRARPCVASRSAPQFSPPITPDLFAQPQDAKQGHEIAVDGFVQLGTRERLEDISKVALSAKQGSPFRQTGWPFSPTKVALSANLYKTTKTNKTTTKRARGMDASAALPIDPAEGRRRCSSDPTPANPPATAHVAQLEALHLPAKLDAAWHGAVLQTVRTAPAGIQQLLLDELAGQLRIEGKVIHNPAGWLHALIRRHREHGQIDWAMAEKVAADRKQRERTQEAVERANRKAMGEATASRQSKPQDKQENEKIALSERARASLAALRDLRNDISRKSAA